MCSVTVICTAFRNYNLKIKSHSHWARWSAL